MVECCAEAVGIGEAFVEGVIVESRIADEAVFVDSVGLASCVVAEDRELNTYVLLGMILKRILVIGIVRSLLFNGVLLYNNYDT